MRRELFSAVTVVFLGTQAAAAAQDPSAAIYDESRLTTYRLTMNAAGWNAICNDGSGQGELWQRADLEWSNGTFAEVVAGVGVKRAGKSGTGTDTEKPAVRISFNEFEFQAQKRKWRGVNRIKLDAMWIPNNDPAQMRDRLSYWIHREIGSVAPRASHARLYVNGSYKGVYTVEEPVKEPFANNRWGEDDGNLYQASFVRYDWRGSDPALYVDGDFQEVVNGARAPTPWPFQIENNWPGGNYRDLVNLIDTFYNAPVGDVRSRLASQINVDGFLSHIAASAAIGDGDNCIVTWKRDYAFRAPNGTGGTTSGVTWGANNHFWYHRAGTNRMEIIKWDPGVSFGNYEAQNGTPKGETPVELERHLLTRWIPADPAAQQAFLSKMTRIVNDILPRARARVDYVYAQIRGAVYEDTLKGSPNTLTNAQFDSAVVWLKEWIDRRILFLRTKFSIPAATLPTVTISATDGSAAEPSDIGTFAITRTGSTSGSLAVTLSRSGTATSGSDYTGVGTSVTLAAGQASATVTVTPVDDTLDENDETVILTIAANAAYTMGTPSSATVTIADNDTAPPPTLPTVTITASDPNAAEPSNTGTFTVTRTGSTAASLSVVRARSGTATSGTDFNGLPSPLVIPAGQASVTVTVTPIDDTVVEGPETVILTISPDPAYTVGTPSSATVTIADNDTVPPPPTLPTVTITATDPNAGEPGNTGAFTVTRTGPTTASLSVVRARSGTATSGADFNGLPSPIAIPAGQASVTVTVTPIDDTAVEGNETVILTISPDPAYTVGAPSSATVTIADNDTATGAGLSGTYYDNADFTGASVTRTDPTVDFNWVDQSPAAGIGPDTFSIRWTGRVRPQYSETYTFYTFTNDGVRLWVEGELLVDRWVQQSGGVEWSAQMALQAGRWYTVQMDYYEGVGNSVARLSWSSPSTPKQVIPQSALDPALGAPDSRDNDGDGIPNDTDPDDDNDGIPDLQDPDRDGDGATNLVEISSGTDPDDRASLPGGPGGGVPTSQRGGENANGDAWINDRCAGGSIPAVGGPSLGTVFFLSFLGLAIAVRRRA